MQEFRKYIKKIKNYEEAVGVLQWDLRTGAPRKGMDSRAEVIGMLSTEMFKLSISDEMGQYIEKFTQPEKFASLDPTDQKIVIECQKEYERSVRIPAEDYEAYVVLTAQSESVWEEAKEASDYQRFQPYLEKIIDYNQQFIQLWGMKETPYDTLLDIYEPGMTAAKLDQVFGELRQKLVPLVSAIQESAHKPNTDFLHHSFDQEKQREFSIFILEQMGYDFRAGRLDKSAHPFATGLSPGDVRITTNFYPNDISFSLFSSIHEGGHALYEQNISRDLEGTLLCTGTSMGIHESQSRLWENMIGRSESFWKRYYTDLQKHFPDAFSQTELQDFYRAVNEVKPSLIRIEADELTYNLHIMIRYELEKMLFNGDLRAADLPEAWNAKYKDYLGIVPPNHREGVLQDVHWSAGLFGYFPSYALGNMYAAQMMNTMKQEMPDMDQLVAGGKLSPLKDWLSEKIYRFGKLQTPGEIIKNVSGEELNPTYMVQYLEQKYRKIYQI
jgi:carboxypeptidase Taq